MAEKYLVIDGNSLGHFANNGRRLTIGEMPVQAIYNFLRNFRQQVALYNQHVPLILWDGMSWRDQVFPDYKAIRKKADTPSEIKAQKLKAEYKKQAVQIKRALEFLGIAQVSAMNMEADDIAAMITDGYVSKGASVVLLTGDEDWLQLVQKGVVWRNFKDVKVNVENFREHTGAATAEEFVTIKSLSGDAGDSIPGVGGVGKKGAIEFVKKYGTYDNFVENACLHKTIDVPKLPKKYRDLIEDENKAIKFKRNVGLVDLRTKERPELVGFRVNRGEADLEKFRRFCEILLFNSILQNFEEWMRVFPSFHHLNEQFEAA